jgi:hypothetical protein
LGLPDPDLLVRGTDPAPTIIKQITKKLEKKKLFVVGLLKVNEKKSRIQIRIC